MTKAGEQPTITLLPCPFCGKIPELRWHSSPECWVECECGAVGPNDADTTTDENMAAWNTRTASLAAQDVTPDAYMRACRALHWRTAQLRYYGIDPYPLWDEAPHDPPEDFDFSKGGRKPRPLAAQDGLVEALGAIHFYVDASDLELQEVGMSRTDALIHARRLREAALSAIKGDKS